MWLFRMCANNLDDALVCSPQSVNLRALWVGRRSTLKNSGSSFPRLTFLDRHLKALTRLCLTCFSLGTLKGECVDFRRVDPKDSRFGSSRKPHQLNCLWTFGDLQKLAEFIFFSSLVALLASQSANRLSGGADAEQTGRLTA